MSQVLAVAVEEYLQKFEKEEREGSLEFICEYVIENNCSLTLKQGNIEGDARNLVAYIFNQLKKHLKYLTIILPKGFKFRLHKRQFEESQQSLALRNGMNPFAYPLTAS